MHRAIVLRWGLVSFLVGIALASFIPVPLSALLIGIGIAGVFLLWGGRGTLVGVAFLSLIYGIHLASVELSDQTPLYQMVGQKASLAGYVDGDFQITKTGAQFPLRVGSEDVLVLQSAWPPRHYGEQLQVSGSLVLPKNSATFDYVSYLRVSNIRTILQVRDVHEVEVSLSPARRSWIAVRVGLYRVRDAIAGSLARSVGQPSSSYLVGILAGQRSTISQSIKDAFARTGTSHILAISGYNITIVAQVIMIGLLGVMSRRRALPWALAGIWVFTMLVGAGSSVVRAAIMGSLMLIAEQLGRLSSAENAILLSAAVMCWLNPLILISDVSFQLSFMAIIGLVYLEPLIRPLVAKVVPYETLGSMAATTIAAQLATLPLLLYYFGNISIYALPANILVLPFVPLAMALGLATALVGLVVPLVGRLVGVLAWLVSTYQLSVIRWFSHLPLAGLSWYIDSGMMIALYVIIFCLYVLYRKPKSRLAANTPS